MLNDARDENTDRKSIQTTDISANVSENSGKVNIGPSLEKAGSEEVNAKCVSGV